MRRDATGIGRLLALANCRKESHFLDDLLQSYRFRQIAYGFKDKFFVGHATNPTA